MNTKTRPLPKRRNPEASSLRHPIFRQRIIKSRKTYNRKRQKQDGE